MIKSNKLQAQEYIDLVKMERSIKKIFKLQPVYEESFEDLKSILANKYANKRGFIKLFCQVLNYMDVEYELAFNISRFNDKFDKDFEAWNQITEAFIYIPSLKYYIMPSDAAVNNGWLSSSFANCNALYIKKITLGDNELGQGKVKFTESNSATINHDDMFIDLKLDDNFDDVKYTLKRVLKGETNTDLQTVWADVSEENKSKIYDGYLKITGENCKYTMPEAVNGIDDVANGFPFTVKGEVTDASLWEKAGNKYFFKVGTLIGPQSELYTKEERQNPIENTYNHGYHRVITFTIPDGYSIANLNDIKIEAKLDKDGKSACYFKSDYKIEGNKVTITCDEEYFIIDLPLSDYEQFRKVINASADFNKVKFIFIKK
ncbi:MAG: hypothetical protein HYZ42_10005 [Bacteroidetes bacterium]|nr:hypothetical protein [Bacteroidota bacterium]